MIGSALPSAGGLMRMITSETYVERYLCGRDGGDAETVTYHSMRRKLTRLRQSAAVAITGLLRWGV
jgi:hypothetical protein